MKKVFIYSSLFMTFTIGLIVCLSYFKTHPRARILNIGALDNLDKTRLINHLDEKMFFVLIDSDKNEFVGFQIDKYLGNSHYRVHYDTLAVHDTIPGMFVYPPGEMDSFYLSNTISSIHIDKLREKIYDSKDVYHDDGWFFEYEGDKDLFSRIDDSFAIFFIGGFLIFLGLLFLEIFIFLLRKYFNIDSRFWIYFIVLLLSILFYQNMIAAGLWPKVQIESFMRPIILMTPAFIIYQWHRIKKDSDLEFLPSQLIKFLLIFIVALISIFLAERFALYIAASEKRAVLMGHTTLTIAFIYSFALGNLLFNIARHGWSLRGANKNLAVAKKQVLSSESKLESLQSSVNPHFLYNSLNSIAALAKIDPERTEKMTLALSEFYKYNTNRDQNEMSSIAEEVKMVRTYLEIEKIRFEDRLQYDISVADGLEEIKIPHFLLQPIVENAIKYGYDKETSKISIKLEIDKLQDDIVIKVYDEGAPFSEDMQKGFGLKSVSQKLKLFYPATHELAFINQPQKLVSITLKQSV